MANHSTLASVCSTSSEFLITKTTSMYTWTLFSLFCFAILEKCFTRRHRGFSHNGTGIFYCLIFSTSRISTLNHAGSFDKLCTLYHIPLSAPKCTQENIYDGRERIPGACLTAHRSNRPDHRDALMLDRSAVGQLSSLSSRTKWQRLPAGDTLGSASPIGNRSHFVLLDNDESCPTADLSNIMPSQCSGLFDR